MPMTLWHSWGCRRKTGGQSWAELKFCRALYISIFEEFSRRDDKRHGPPVPVSTWGCWVFVAKAFPRENMSAEPTKQCACRQLSNGHVPSSALEGKAQACARGLALGTPVLQEASERNEDNFYPQRTHHCWQFPALPTREEDTGYGHICTYPYIIFVYQNDDWPLNLRYICLKNRLATQTPWF